MKTEKRDLGKLLELIQKVDDHLYNMQFNESAFVVNDRLHEELNDQSLYEWFDEVSSTVIHGISQRITELNDA